MAERFKALILKINILIFRYHGFESHLNRFIFRLNVWYMFTHQSNFFIHFNELKVRTFYFLISFISTFFISYLYRIEIFYSISKLFLQHERGFIYTGVLDPFFVYIQLSLFISFVFTFIFSIYIYGFYFFKSFYNRIGRFFF